MPEHIGNHYSAYSLNLIIDSAHPGMLDSNGNYACPSLYSYEDKGEFIPGYTAIQMKRPVNQPKFLFTVRDTAKDANLTIGDWTITLTTSEKTPFQHLDMKGSGSRGGTQGPDYYDYNLSDTKFKPEHDIALQGHYLLGMQVTVILNGVKMVFKSDPEMIIDDGVGAVHHAHAGHC